MPTANKGVLVKWCVLRVCLRLLLGLCPRTDRVYVYLYVCIVLIHSIDRYLLLLL